MTGGDITGNTALNNGGGVFVKDGTCFIVGGTISGNTAGSGKGNNVYSLSANVYIISGCVSDGIDADEDSHIPTQSSFGNGDGSANFTRCYYTRRFGNIQGKQRCRITAGENVTLALSGTATEYDVSGITSYADNQGLKYESTYYAGENDAVKLTLGHTDREGYEFHDYTASAGILDDSATPSTLTMPAANVTITAVWEPMNKISLNASLIDGLYWTTFYCGDAGYRIADDENACAYTAEVGNDVITLHKLGKMIPKDKAVIIAGDDNSISMTRDDVSAAEYSVKNNLHGVDVPTARTTLTSDDTKTLYMLSNKNNHFGFHQYGGANVPARKAYFTVSSSANAPEYLGFDGETTGIISNTDFTDSTNMDGVWYSLDGRKLQGMPTQKGIYIYKGKKRVL
jgi:hypothetical protein